MKVEQIATRLDLLNDAEVREKVGQEVGSQLRKALLEAKKEFKRQKYESILALDKPTRVDIYHAAHTALSQGISKIGECLNTQRFESKIINPMLELLGQQKYEKSEEYRLEKMYKRIVESCDNIESNQSKEEEQQNEVKDQEGGKESERAEEVKKAEEVEQTKKIEEFKEVKKTKEEAMEVQKAKEEAKEVVEIREEVVLIEEVVQEMTEEVVQKPSPEQKQAPAIQPKSEPQNITPSNIFLSKPSNPTTFFTSWPPQPVDKPTNPLSNFFKTEDKPASIFNAPSSLFGASLSQAAQVEPKKQEPTRPLASGIFNTSKTAEHFNLFNSPAPSGSLFFGNPNATQKSQAPPISSCFAQGSKDKKTLRIS